MTACRSPTRACHRARHPAHYAGRGGDVAVMAVGHALSGFAAGAALAGHAFGGGPAAATVGGVVTAGAALLPDLDHPEATASRRFGAVSVAVSAWIRAASSSVYRATRTEGDRYAERYRQPVGGRSPARRVGGSGGGVGGPVGGVAVSGEHSYLTHTLAFGLAAGAANALAGLALGLVAVLAVAGVAVALAVAVLGGAVWRLVALAGWRGGRPHRTRWRPLPPSMAPGWRSAPR